VTDEISREETTRGEEEKERTDSGTETDRRKSLSIGKAEAEARVERD
jgi:hypothetical protein